MLKNIFSLEVFAELHNGGGRSGGGGTVRRYNSNTGNMVRVRRGRGRGTLEQQAQRSRNAATRNALQALGVR